MLTVHNMHRHPQLIEAAGGQCVTGERAGRVEVLSLEQLAAADPEVIVFVPCGYDLERGARELLQTPLLQSEGARMLGMTVECSASDAEQRRRTAAAAIALLVNRAASVRIELLSTDVQPTLAQLPRFMTEQALREGCIQCGGLLHIASVQAVRSSAKPAAAVSLHWPAPRHTCGPDMHK